LKSLTALHQAHADEPALRNHWAFSAVFFIVRRATEEPGRCLGLLDTLATLHGAHADEPILREHWAQGIMGFISRRAAEDPQRVTSIKHGRG